MRRRAAILGLLAALALAPAIEALEVTSGLLKLTLHEGTGRFSLQSLASTADSTWTPLMVAEDPRTSWVSLLVGNRVYRLGDSPEFRESAEQTDVGARFIWSSPSLTVTESFAFIAAQGSALASGVRIDLAVRNASEQNLTVGVRYLFDTYLGEASGAHFRTDVMVQVNRELLISREERPGYWLSPQGSEPGGFGLESQLSGEGITPPDRVVFANWKRLNDASWTYDASPTRTFSQLPYSVNDSAVCQYYDPRSVARGGDFTITLALGRYSPNGFSLLPVAATPAQFATSVREAIAISAAAQDRELAANADLAALNLLLAEIDRRLGSAAAISNEELDVIEQAIAALKERSARYGQ